MSRLDADGQPDDTFGADGSSVPGGSSPVQGSYAGAVAIQPDGKILIADGWTADAFRLDANAMPDTSFGVDGMAFIYSETGAQPQVIQAGQPPTFGPGAAGLALTSNNKILVAQKSGGLTRLIVNGATNDFNEDGISDPAIFIASNGVFAYAASGGGGTLFPIGPPGFDQTLPAPGAYDGGGVDEPAVYLPALGEFVIHSATITQGGSTTIRVVPFGLPGFNSLPAPGDYDGSGRTEVGIYDPITGIYAYRSAKGGPDTYISIGTSNPGTIPVPGDYFGTGQDDVAVYDATTARFMIRDPQNGQIVTVPFGIPGIGNSIPVPGDYDGSGQTELAVYLPNQAEVVYRPALGGKDVVIPFGTPGIGATLPAPGDYDGSGHTEVAGYLTASGIFAYRPEIGDRDVYQQIGAPYQTSPFTLASATDTTILIPQQLAPGTAQTTDSASAEVPLTPDVLDSLTGTNVKKKAGQA